MAKLPNRNEVPIQETWNLLDIFNSEEDYMRAVSKLEEQANKLVTTYQDKIHEFSDTNQLQQLATDYSELVTNAQQLRGYAFLNAQVDMTNPHHQKRLGSLGLTMSNTFSKLSFIKSELTQLDNDLLDQAITKTDFKVYYEDIITQKIRQLEPQSEIVLAALQPVLSLPYGGYEITKLSDMVFDDFQADDNMHPLSFVQFENQYQTHENTEIRRKAFTQFSKNLKTYENTVANYYNTQLKKEKILSSLRGYDSVFDYLLEDQKVSIDLYNRQIDVLMEKLSGPMRKYARKLKEKLGVEKLYYSDLKAPYIQEENKSITYAQARDLVIKSLQPMGDEYVKIATESLDNRWIDYASNAGKSTGGFCSSISGIHPYILLSWNNSLSEVFTLTHEIGHAIQAVFSQRKYPMPLQRQSSLYTIETPSTFNEMMLGNYLLSQNPELKQWVAATMLENTYYHNFVTHFLEAAFQREVYKLVDKNTDLQASDFNQIFKEQLEKFWGDDVVLDEGAELTWMRQPHYYMGLYSYTYSAGLTLSTVMSQRMKSTDSQEIEQWIKGLEEIETLTPLEYGQQLGIDLTTEEPLQTTINYIESLIDTLD